MADDKLILKSRIIILRAPYYKEIVSGIEMGVKLESKKLGVADVIDDREVVSVAGALELPLALSFLTHSYKNLIRNDLLGVVVLGCVIRGETEHFSLICREVFNGLQRVALEHSLPLGTGVLACDNKGQAETRAEQAGRQAFNACYNLLLLRQGF